MTIEDINKTLFAAATNKEDKLDFVVGNFQAIAKRHPGEIVLSGYDILTLNTALLNTQTFEEAAANLNSILNPTRSQ